MMLSRIKDRCHGKARELILTERENKVSNWLMYGVCVILKNIIVLYIIPKSMRALWLVNQLWVNVPANPQKNRASLNYFIKAIDHKFLWLIS